MPVAHGYDGYDYDGYDDDGYDGHSHSNQKFELYELF